MQKIILLKGLPASGKSTAAKAWIKLNPEFERINKDDIREELGNPPFSRKFENEVLKIQRERGLEILKSGKSLIVDDTNFAKKHKNFWKNIAEKGIENSEISNIEFEIWEFTTSLEECIERDSKREKSVGESVIRGMYEKYIKP